MSYQDWVMTLTPEALAQERQRLTQSLVQSSGPARRRHRRHLVYVEAACNGVNYKEAQQARIKTLQKKRDLMDRRAKRLAQKETLIIPPDLLWRFTSDRKYDRATLQTYRGEQKAHQRTNTGVAIYGQGRYTTTSKEYAAKFGVVRKATIDERPERPLCFDTINDFEILLSQWLDRKHIDKMSFHQAFEIHTFVLKCGYDGLVLGPIDDAIVVAFSPVSNNAE